MTKLYCLLCTVVLAFTVDLAGQVTEEMLRQQLIERGIDEDEFRQRLRDRGVPYQTLEEVPEEQIPEIQTIVQEILAEMEREKAAPPTLDTTPPTDELLTAPEQEVIQDVQTSVLEGATLEEAIAEEVTDDPPDLPPGNVYGQDIFRNQTLQVFRQADDIKPRDSYRLGSGDELTISIWGTSIAENTYIIDAAGYVKPTKMPRIFLRNLTFDAAKRKLRSNFAQFFRFNNDQFEVSLRHARTISIGIFGEVFNPGNHTVSAINTAFNALVAAGGPTDIGTLRKIKWIKGDGSVNEIDVYAYMSDPTIGEDYYLEDNDILQVPIAQRVVGISGAVNRPMRYELIEGEELKALIDYAGGLLPNAYRRIIQLKRFENDQQRVIDIPLDQILRDGSDFALRNGDAITVRTIPSPYKNYVSIDGSVELAGEYEYLQGMRISDLLAKGVLTDESQREFAVLRRNNRDGTSDFVRVDLGEILRNPASNANQILAPGDQLTIYQKSKFIDSHEVSVSGQVRNPGTFPFDPSQNMRVRDAVMMAGDLVNSATDFAYIIRQDLSTGEPEYISINIRDAMADPGSADNLILQPRDQLRIQSQSAFLDEATVNISGSVRNPGSYPFDESLGLRDLILLANGLSLQAAYNRVDVSRMVIEQNQPTKVIVATLTLDEDYNPINDPSFQLEPYDRVNVRAVPEFEFQKVVNIEGEVLYPGAYSIITDNERLTSLVNRAGGLTVEAFPEGATLVRSEAGIGPIIIDMAQVLNNERADANIILKDGDQIFIPKIQDFVSLDGAINSQELFRSDLLGADNRVTVIFEGARSARYYIDKFAGGFADNGDRRKVTVEYPNGQIKKVKNFGLFNVYPRVDKGSIVHVGTKDPRVERQPGEREKVDWGSVLGDAVGQATAVLTLILLLDRASSR